MKMLTFTEAAEYAGVNVKTIHKHVKQGKLECVSTPFGRRVPEAALAPYRELKGLVDHDEPEATIRVPERSSIAGRGEAHHASPPVSTINPGLPPSTVTAEERAAPLGENTDRLGEVIPLVAHLAALDLARSEIDRLHLQMDRAQAEARSDLAEERRRTEQAERTREQAERARMALEFQLQQYQTALGEQAASLAEERALRVAAEARAKEARMSELEKPVLVTPPSEVGAEQASPVDQQRDLESTPLISESKLLPKSERKSPGLWSRVGRFFGVSKAN